MRRSAAFGLWQRWHEKSPKVCGLWASRWAHFRGATGGGVILQIQESLPHHQLWPCLLVHTFLDVQGRGGHKLGKHVLVYPWGARATIGTTIGGLLQGVGLHMFQGVEMGKGCDGFIPTADFIAVTNFPLEEMDQSPSHPTPQVW